MRLEVTRRGGLSGIPLHGSADTDSLPPPARLAAEAALRALPFGRPAPSISHPEAFQFEITVNDGATTRSAVLNEDELPSGLRSVVQDAIARGSLG